MRINSYASSWLRSFRGRRAEAYSCAYRRLAMQLLHDLAPLAAGGRTILMSTPSACTVFAHGGLELASCLGDEVKQSVLLVDFSPGTHQTSSILQCADQPGCVDLLTDPSIDLDDLVLPTSGDNVFFLPAGVTHGNAPRADFERVTALLDVAAKQYRYVLLSGGPMLSDSLALAVAPFVNRVLLFVVDGETRVQDVDAAQEVLSFCNVNNVGLVYTTPLRNGLITYAANGNTDGFGDGNGQGPSESS